MLDKWLSKIYEEIKKIRGYQDKIQAYLKTIAENTTPADSDDTEPTADDT